jgi:aspartate kinase
MKIFKFGGASAASIERIQKLPGILRAYGGDNILVVISAMGKTTNALEKVVEAFYGGHREEALKLFQQVKDSHLTTAKYLLTGNYLAAEAQLKDFFTEVEWLLHDKPVRDYDYYYDQVVCVGELLSTSAPTWRNPASTINGSMYGISFEPTIISGMRPSTGALPKRGCRRKCCPCSMRLRW